MKVTNEQIKYLSNISHLGLKQEESQRMKEQLESMLGFIDKLSELDTSGIKETFSVIEAENIFRDDIVQPSYDRDKILSNAPLKQDGCFKVPNVME